jgi:hypothetical protein
LIVIVCKDSPEAISITLPTGKFLDGTKSKTRTVEKINAIKKVMPALFLFNLCEAK